jgi:hypothetical protein
MRDESGNLATVTLNGSTNTLKLIRPTATPDVNINFMMLVSVPGPITLTASLIGANLNISFPSQIGLTYQVEYKNDLADAVWTPVGGPISGDGTTKTVSDTVGLTKRFYRARIQ